MDKMPSTQFRKTFSRLTDATTVTVNGHIIGEWVPVRTARYQTVQEVKATLAAVRRDVDEVAAERFNTRPFTPVPKKGK
jgi:hypothetical protein